MVPLVFLYAGFQIAAKQAAPYLSGAVSYISGTAMPKNIFAEKQWSGFLEYYLYPDYQVMCDPAMMQSSGVTADYDAIASGGGGCLETAAKYGINSFLLDMKSPAAQYLKGPGYAVAYFDDRDIIFVDRSRTGRYFRYINPLGNDFDRANTVSALSEIEPFSEDFPSERAQLMTAKIYACGDKSRAIDYLSDMIDKFPANYKLYNYKGRLLYEAGDYENAREALSASKERGTEEDEMLKDSVLKLKGK